MLSTSPRDQRQLKPTEIFEQTINICNGKANSSTGRLVMFGILAGIFIALAAAGSTTACSNLLSNPDTFGQAKLIQGLLFTPGLMMVLVAGSELFTGDMLILTSVLEKKVTVSRFITLLVIVFISNLVGSLIVAFLMSGSGLFSGGAGIVGATTVKIAAGKTALSFSRALILGIFCNFVVCIAVWMSFGAATTMGKLFTAFFPIWLFVVSGFEHCVANMYYIPAGILAAANQDFVAASGASAEALSTLTWGGFFVNNLLPVTLGNMIGGLFVAFAYWFVYRMSPAKK